MPQSKLTPALIKKVLAKIKLGNYRVTAFAMVGISRQCWGAWVTAGKKVHSGEIYKPTAHEQRCAELVTKLEKAEAEVESQIVEDILHCDDPDLKLKFAERRWNKRWNKNPNAKVDDETGKAEEPDAKEVLEELLTQLAKSRK